MEDHFLTLAFTSISTGWIYISEIKRDDNLITPLTITTFPLIIISIATNFVFVFSM